MRVNSKCVHSKCSLFLLWQDIFVLKSKNKYSEIMPRILILKFTLCLCMSARHITSHSNLSLQTLLLLLILKFMWVQFQKTLAADFSECKSSLKMHWRFWNITQLQFKIYGQIVKKNWGGDYKAMCVSHRELSIGREATVAIILEIRNQTAELLSSHGQPGTQWASIGIAFTSTFLLSHPVEMPILMALHSEYWTLPCMEPATCTNSELQRDSLVLRLWWPLKRRLPSRSSLWGLAVLNTSGNEM